MGRRVSVRSVLLVGLFGLGCHLLEVESPLRVPAERLNDPKLAMVLVGGAIGDFECAFGNYVAAVAQVTDEFYGSAPLVANMPIALRRDNGITNPQGLPGCSQVISQPSGQVYLPLSTARYQADDTYARLEGFPDSLVTAGKTMLMAKVETYAAYAYTLFGEGFCTAAFDGGPELKPSEVLAIADQKFTSALSLAQTVNDADLMNFARVGRARVRLDQGRLQEAAVDAKLVSTNYVRNATFSSDSPRRQNQVYVWNNGAAWATIDTSFRNRAVGTIPDRRVPVQDANENAADGLTRLWIQTKYPSDASPIPIATWEEAQLIIAEAEGGQSAVTHINLLRNKVGLADFVSADSATIAKQVREERRRQLFLQGHRLNDMLRFTLPFKSGRNSRGQSYGNLKCFPLPLSETDNNPNIVR
jgi:hypothetical protein